MKKFNKNSVLSIYDKITVVGVNLSIISSIIKFLDVSINDNTNFSKADVHNLVITLKKMHNIVINDYSEIEKIIDT